MDKEYIENDFIYQHTWLRYHIYSSINYRICLPNGIYIILNEKENYLHTNHTDYMLQVFIEQGYGIYTIRDLKVDKKRLKFIKIEDYLEKMFKKDEKLDFLNKILNGGII